MNRNYILKSTSLSAALVSVLALSSVPAQAQQPAEQSETQALRQQIEDLQKRLDAIEAAQKKAADAAAATAAAGTAAGATTPGTATANTKAPGAPGAATGGISVTSKEKIVVSGTLQVHTLDYLGEDARTGGVRGNDTFRLRRGELRVTMPTITNRISGTLMIDPAKAIGGRTNIANGTNLNIRARDNVLQEIAISYALAQDPKNRNTATVDIGQYKIPLGYEGDRVSASGLTFVERALLFTQRDTQDGGYGDVRDSGLQVRGTLGGRVDYNLGIFNGLGDLQNSQALSDQKAFIGRLIYRPAAVNGLQIGVSGAIDHSATLTSVTRSKRDLYNAFAAYRRKKLGLQTEFLAGESQLIGSAAASKVRGYYGSVSYLFTPKLEGAFRYDSFNGDRSLADATTHDYTLGLNYYIKGNNAKIQANIVQRNGGSNAPAAIRNDRTELRTNFQIAF